MLGREKIIDFREKKENQSSAEKEISKLFFSEIDSLRKRNLILIGMLFVNFISILTIAIIFLTQRSVQDIVTNPTHQSSLIPQNKHQDKKSQSFLTTADKETKEKKTPVLSIESKKAIVIPPVKIEELVNAFFQGVTVFCKGGDGFYLVSAKLNDRYYPGKKVFVKFLNKKTGKVQIFKPENCQILE